jgi:hypothetical protein
MASPENGMNPSGIDEAARNGGRPMLNTQTLLPISFVCLLLAVAVAWGVLTTRVESVCEDVASLQHEAAPREVVDARLKGMDDRLSRMEGTLDRIGQKLGVQP